MLGPFDDVDVDESTRENEVEEYITSSAWRQCQCWYQVAGSWEGNNKTAGSVKYEEITEHLND